ncbi:hypothetical protein QLL95_gp0435 [Cotonvirus japonicus]|uniref:Methyltransferase n=1 Tax=Cotonvirus japonicus TaxID=2811091 RepID=A0ABM7NU23_9VIRU|nr:hypothetical protein QLL95_gp0435 [Cotonvirus japonicus]BCS83688.1 hypothetical protein [Cotonvirus japonicus]
MLKAFISQDPRDNFLHYLNENDNGTKQNLTNQLIFLERKWIVPCSGIYIFTKMFDNKIWEIPTNELCEGLIYLFKHLDISIINELAAGNGLLSARLKHFANKLNHELDITTSDGTSKVFGQHKFTYTKVDDLNVYDYDKSEPIIISWIHALFEKELLFSVKKNLQDYIFLVGQHPDEGSHGSNHSFLFHREILSYGYDFIVLPFKQISQVDYYSFDRIRRDIYNESRTCVTLYYRLDKKLIVVKAIAYLKDNHIELFGNYMEKNVEYYRQDGILVRISDENIEKYIKNNFHDLKLQYVLGLKNYVSQKLNFFVKEVYDLESNCLIKQSNMHKNLFRYEFNNVFGSFTCMTFNSEVTEQLWNINPIKRISTIMVKAKFHNNAY